METLAKYFISLGRRPIADDDILIDYSEPQSSRVSSVGYKSTIKSVPNVAERPRQDESGNYVFSHGVIRMDSHGGVQVRFNVDGSKYISIASGNEISLIDERTKKTVNTVKCPYEIEPEFSNLTVLFESK